ncbi:hypothetical protein B0I72DRAFT_138428 [Yarrowia lipolytica]|jgi:hypothetical protein|uniref:YALI0D01551p n=2 Tax=Yarrowia lipolytica TaxID=4952 RepID=Q6CAM1_YARLI|nr:YALI0D01551p [Yarrowia lipolytica CLIB122]AOW03433.1 hypothetical protein YALI1_D01819g [Yarrowia lipolytica]KAB8282538.1 hypothetical protein BKA91DRAFT_20923 [Yarrowia lipolytica]KAE8173189.1 hypothetical protein BKA90DRAFT_173514 [Yarrowia lipolytica]KAJ8054912.1 hypothetical protein LXG23DRAFT_49140 [Yarrowia lipolytica]QNP97591.1 Hypothetical protein YALI2_D00032g [Yarrowia lipolytica]|eukprot:XP_502291.2 YALI0D01551p [Yarrowia lipolytica CLIB122]
MNDSLNSTENGWTHTESYSDYDLADIESNPEKISDISDAPFPMDFQLVIFMDMLLDLLLGHLSLDFESSNQARGLRNLRDGDDILVDVLKDRTSRKWSFLQDSLSILSEAAAKSIDCHCRVG